MIARRGASGKHKRGLVTNELHWTPRVPPRPMTRFAIPRAGRIMNAPAAPEASPLAYPTHLPLQHLVGVIAPTAGAVIAVAVAVVYGVPAHAVVGMFVMAYATGFGVTLGFHRLFAHRSFSTSRPVEWLLMVLGCAAGQSAPFFWIATHRLHHRHSDSDGDPHSPHNLDGRPLGWWRGFWHAHVGWVLGRGFGYPAGVVRDLAARPDLAWIDRRWLLWYVLGLLVPALVGYAIGGTAYDALMGLLWGGLLRHFLTIQATFLVNSLNHLWGTRPYATADHSRNNLVTGILAFGEGWHNNHHAFPWSARHGLRWWQPDLSWWVLWTLERAGLVWRVRRPRHTAQ
jgi:stearoyl-CoA desaturase (delta-9 desaturase)